MLLTVGLPSYFSGAAVVEIYEYTANTPFASATKIEEGRGNIFSIPQREASPVTRYYWTRIRDHKVR